MSVEHLVKLKQLEASQCRVMNHPSKLFEMEGGAIVGRHDVYTCTAAACSENGYLAHFHHFEGTDGRFYTRIEVDCLTKLEYVGDMIYEWAGTHAYVPWIADPKLHCFALTVSKTCMAFATTENSLSVLNLPWQRDGALRVFDFTPMLPLSDQPTAPQQVAVASCGEYIWTMVDYPRRARQCLVLITNLETNQVQRLETTAVRACITRFTGVPLFHVCTEFFLFAFNYYDASGVVKLQVCAVSRLTNQLFAAPTDKFDGLLGVNVRGEPMVNIDCVDISKRSRFLRLLSTLRELSKSFALPFVSPISSTDSRLPDLSTRLSSPWAIPVALMHIALFVLFLPFLLIPKQQNTIHVRFDNDGLFHTTLHTSWTLHQHPTTPLHYQLPPDIHLKQATSSSSKLQFCKFYPTALSRQIYSKCDTLRILSCAVYVTCAIGFAMATWQVLSVPGAVFDLVTMIALADSLAIYGLAFCQDFATFLPLVAYHMRTLLWGIRARHQMYKYS